MKQILLLLGMLLIMAGCNFREREQALKDRELALNAKEQELFNREQQLQLKESDLQLQVQQLDSSRIDTAIIYNADLVGRWNVKMICTETSCNGSAIGDAKSEVWDIYYKDRRVIAKAIDGNKLVRIYTGTSVVGGLELTEDVDMSPGIPTTQMFVRLTMTDAGAMSGQREIVRTGDCRILYSLQLKKQ